MRVHGRRWSGSESLTLACCRRRLASVSLRDTATRFGVGVLDPSRRFWLGRSSPMSNSREAYPVGGVWLPSTETGLGLRVGIAPPADGPAGTEPFDMATQAGDNANCVTDPTGLSP